MWSAQLEGLGSKPDRVTLVMATPVIIVKEGLFWDQEGLCIQVEDGEVFRLEEALGPLIGRTCELVLHHAPPVPPLPHEPGFGCCHWGPHCPAGHGDDPTFLYHGKWKGVLEHAVSGSWSVGGREIPLHAKMAGHRGRVVLFVEGEVDEAASVDDLLGQAEDLLQTLKGLKSTIKDG